MEEKENENIEARPVIDESMSIEEQLTINNERIAELEEALEVTKKEAEDKSKWYLQYYRQVQMLKKCLEAIMATHNITLGDVYETMMESNSIDMDALLMTLSK